MAEVFGPGHVYAPRVHDQAADWLPDNPCYLDGITGGQLAIAGEIPVVCSIGSVTSAAADLLECAGLRLPPKLFTFQAGGSLDAVKTALGSSERLVLQHVFPEASPFAERCWIPQQLLRDLNNKGKLAEFVPSAAVPDRRVADSSEYFAADENILPAVIKVVTDQSSAGGSGVMICRSHEDLAVARAKFARSEKIVVEELLEVARSPCLNFAVMPDGAVRYLGHAEQDVASDGKFRGNWVSFGETLPAEFIRPAMDAVVCAAKMGYRGFAGVDLVITPTAEVYVVDLNFRINASTPAVLLAPSLASRLGEGVAHFRALKGSTNAADLARSLMPLVKSDRLIPLSLFDPAAAGYQSQAPSAQVLMLGASRSDVMATEQELAQCGIV